MDDPATKTEFEQLDSGSNQFIEIILAHLQSDRGVHLETAICAASSMAGVLLLRSTGVDLSPLKPGVPVFVEQVNDMGTELLGFMARVCQAMGIDPNTGWNQSAPDNHQSLESGIELVRDMERPFGEMADRLSIAGPLRPNVAALSAVKLIKMGSQTLSPEIGKAIVLTSLMAACKTVPYNV